MCIRDRYGGDVRAFWRYFVELHVTGQLESGFLGCIRHTGSTYINDDLSLIHILLRNLLMRIYFADRVG